LALDREIVASRLAILDENLSPLESFPGRPVSGRSVQRLDTEAPDEAGFPGER
jgi:hypothetical protein